MFLTAIRKEKESIRLEGKLEGERLGTVKGAIEMGLELKFGEDSLMLIKQIKHINDLSKLEKIKDAVKKESSLEKIAGLINTL